MPTGKHLLTEAQLESVTSPTRLAIIQRLEVDKRATVRELAGHMGRATTALYHHIKELQKVGLVRITAEKQGMRRPEAVYSLVAPCLSSAEAIKTQKGRLVYSRAGTRVADAAARAFAGAVQQRTTRFDGSNRNAAIRFFVLRADRQKLARLNKLLRELEETARHSCVEGEEIQLTFFLSPAKRKSG